MGMTAQIKVLTVEELAVLTADPDCLEDLLFPEGVEDPFEGQFDLDKAWHGIHYILTGQVGPDGSALGDAVLGGEAIGPDLGYGQARLISAERVAEISDALSRVDFAEMFDAVGKSTDQLTGIYLGSDLASELDYFCGYFMTLVEAYATAARSNRAVLAYLA